jgi:hypothetical protein
VRAQRNPVGARVATQHLPIKKTQVVVAFCALVAGSLYYLVYQPLHSPENPLDELLAAQPLVAASLASGNLALLADTDKALAAAEQALSGASTHNRKTRPQPEAVSEPVRTYAWGYSSSRALLPSIGLADAVSVYQQVDIDMEAPAFPSPGEQVSLALPGGEEILVDVKTGATNPNGDYTWRGHLQGHGTDYPVVMTYGGASVFASITTPNGSYTMESVDGSGWVYKNPSEFELSHAGVNDYLEIPMMHDTHE